MNKFARIVPLTRVSISKMSTKLGVVEAGMRNKLEEGLNPSHLDIINESHMHNVPKGSETHFKVIVVSEKFDGMPLIKRHRVVNDILKEELSNSVHALSMVTKTQKQWEEGHTAYEASPACRGGFGK